MKKIFLFSTMLGFAFSYSQMAVQKLDGTPIKDGDVYTYNKYGIDGVNEDGILKFTVGNSSTSQSITVKVLCESVVNSDGDDFQFCFGGNCMPFVIAGQNYPPNGYVIGPQSTSGDSDHFWNLKDGDQPMSYTFKFFMTDPLGNEVGSPVRVTYKYDKTMAVNESSLSKSGIQLKSTVVTDNLEIISLKNANISLFDMNGKQVLNKEIKSGTTSASLNNLNAGVYILNAVTAEGKISNVKIIKK